MVISYNNTMAICYVTGSIFRKLAPILQKAKEVLADRDKNTISRRIEETSRTLENQILVIY